MIVNKITNIVRVNVRFLGIIKSKNEFLYNLKKQALFSKYILYTNIQNFNYAIVIIN